MAVSNDNDPRGPEREGLPYEVTLTNAAPQEYVWAEPAVAHHHHTNGGGFVADTATVAATAYVGPSAMVLDSAQVRDYARIEDYAVVQGTAQVYGNAIVSGHAWIIDSAQVYGYAKVRDYACVKEEARVYDNARLYERATAAGDWGTYFTKVCENGVMRGAASSWDDTGGSNYIKGYSIWDGDATCGVGTTKGVLTGWLRDQAYADSLPDLNGLYCQYDFETAHAVWAWDRYGMVHGLLVGGPTITTDANINRHNVLNLNGSSQYVELRRDIPDVKDIAIMGWMYWTGTATNQRFFSMGDGSSKYMYVTPKDSSTNKLRFVICNGTTTQYLDGAAAIPASTWTHVAVVLSGTSGKIFVGGTPVGTGTISIDPDQLLPANLNNTPACNYLGKGPAGNYFQGKADDFRVYAKPLSDAEVSAIATATIRIVPQMDSLIFGLDTDSFPASGLTGSWTAFYPIGITLAAMGSPTVEVLNSKKWDLNLYADGDGYDQGYYSSPIPCSGASIVVAVKPVRNTTSTPWISIVDVFYNCLVLGIHNNTGEICVYRNAVLNDTGVIIPNGQMTVLSLVVQSNGTYKVWANGTQVVNYTTTSTFTQLAPGAEAYMHNINVGRNWPDSWTTFNGDIGDVFFYKIALSDADRQTLESQTRTKFGF
jgi:carbonic anhydrase/acetyltransferase-like protein (isoleucine patch superfamily)